MAAHAAPIPPGETALIDQIRACATDITAFFARQARLADINYAVTTYPEAYNQTATSLLETRALLFRAYALLLAVKTGAS